MSPGQENILLWTVRLSMALMCGAWAARLLSRKRLARWVWTGGADCMILHILVAFAFVHGWSHTAASEATAAETLEVTGSSFGGGIWFNYAFLLVWIADIAWWWLNERSYLARSKWIDVLIYGFMAFIAFQATVVFETGATRWFGVVATFGLIALATFHRRSRLRSSQTTN